MGLALTLLLRCSQGTVEPLQLSVSGCHPGYTYNTESNRCECSNEENLNILRCDDNNRYLFLRVSGMKQKKNNSCLCSIPGGYLGWNAGA